MADLFHQAENDGPVYNAFRNFDATELAAYDYRHVATADGVVLTPANQGVAYGGPPTNVFQVTADGSDPAVGGNHREFFLQKSKSFEHSEIRSVIFGGGTWADAANRTQQGHVHRFQKLPNGRYRAFVAWHDAFVGNPLVINVGIWEGNGTTTDFNLFSTNNTLSISPAPQYPVTLASLTSNVVSMNVPYGVGNYHHFRDGDLVDVSLAVGSAASVDDVRLTLAFGILMTYPKTNANLTALATGGGYVIKQGPLANFPYVLASRLTSGDTLQAKMYRLGDPEPPWSLTDNNAVYTLAGRQQDHVVPRGPGLNGVMVGHVSGGEVVRFGRPMIRQI